MEVNLMKNSNSTSFKPEEQIGRTSGSKEWREQRGELGSTLEFTASDDNNNTNGNIKWVDEVDEVDPSTTFPTSLFDFDGNTLTTTKQIELVGSSTVSSDRIRLTAKQNSQTGALWYKEKIEIKEGFDTTFKFQVVGPGADGFAFVIQDDDNQLRALGEGGAHMGYGGLKKSVAIEFDTYQTVDRTLDPNGNHISIQSKGNEGNSADHTYSYGCTVAFGGVISDGSVHEVRISYSNSKLKVYFDTMNRPILKSVIDIPNITKSNTFYIGFTASTGGLCETHDILSWKLSLPKK